MIRVRTQKVGRISQGDIYRDIVMYQYVRIVNGNLEARSVGFPYIIVLTQDCDLDQDFKYRHGKSLPRPPNQDKWLLSVLVAPLYNAEHVFLGTHLDMLGINMRQIDSRSERHDIQNNNKPRYHYLQFPDTCPLVPMIIDFKHYFSVDVEYLKRIKGTNFICKVSELYREDISQRFTSFLSRIGLPS